MPASPRKIVALFHARFDPHLVVPADERAAREAAIAAAIEAALQAVESLDEDRILRRFVNAVAAAIRTNFYQRDRDGRAKELIAIKFASRKVDGMPLPRPLYEIFVYSPRVEGVHLRFGKVARGGIRWSDRPQDFRTEILGLVKAQNVKNAVIVPVGAKGGFIPKRLPAGGAREAIQAEGIAAYRLFISTLLDITDNIGTGTTGVVPPADVVRHEGDDPYLVVAADKGTATFSDIANEIAIAHDFWLGDAFASGGSAGYDHKKMGITARGAWESVKRHFREMDVNIGATPFTVVGVGDMSGDVFGNGMLREKTTKLVAAFDHRDIFIDPEPDPERTFAERKRLFDLPRSSWQDFDKTLISKGGGVYPRAAKEIRLSAEAQKLFGVGERLTPQELIRAILKARGRSAVLRRHRHLCARRRRERRGGRRPRQRRRSASPASDLRCKVIGEGANLGMTQRGRIEAALRGIRLNTDAIDNSAGVNTSDMEVNIKIALSIPLRDGRLTMDARNALLAEMTDEVAGLVLRNNYLQTLALSLAERRGMEDFGFLQRLIQTLETRGLLDRAVEYLPDDMQLAERRRRSQPFTRPELAVLLAYAKLSLYDDLLESAVPDDPVSRPRARPLFSQGDRRAFPRRARTSSAAPRDHRHPARQFDDQSRRAFAHRAHRRPDRRRACRHRLGLRRRARQLRHDRAQHRDRRPRQPDSRESAARSLRGGAGPAARPHRLVPAQCRSDQGPRRRGDALSRRHRRGRGRARRRALRRTRLRRARGAPAGAGGEPAFPMSLPAALPISVRLPPRPTSCWSPTAPARRSAKSRRPISPPARSSASTASPAPRATSRLPIISTGWRSTARGIRSATPSAGSPPPWSATAPPAPARSRPGSARARARWSAFAWRSTRSPIPGSRCRSSSVAASLLGDLVKN